MMKSFLLSIGLLASTASFAGSTVCAGGSIYYSHVRRDSGVQPQPGMVIGRDVIAHQGEVLLNEEIVSGLGQHTIREVEFMQGGKEVVLEKTGNQISGSRVVRTQGVLYKIDAHDPEKREEIAKELVICRTTWAMVP